MFMHVSAVVDLMAAAVAVVVGAASRGARLSAGKILLWLR
jgi:hypothetical protein